MRLCLVSSGLEAQRLRLQPWRYLVETARALARAGHQVQLLSDGHPRLPERDALEGFPVTRIGTLQEWPWRANPFILRTLADMQPDVVLWHLGLTSFFRLRTVQQVPMPVVGIFTSPVYQPSELLRLGLPRLLRGWRLSVMPLLGLCVPGAWLRRPFERRWLEHLIVECKTTRDRLAARGAPPERIAVMRPGIDRAWFEIRPTATERAQLREAWGFAPDDVVVGFFGPPTALRGLPTLLRAIAVARKQNARIKLLALVRKREGELDRDYQHVERLAAGLKAAPWVHWITGFLAQEQLIPMLGACDVIALPFEIVPSDVPLSVLEAMALGKPVIATEVVCLPELVGRETGMCLPPKDVVRLAHALQTLAADPEKTKALGLQNEGQARQWCSLAQEKPWTEILPDLKPYG